MRSSTKFVFEAIGTTWTINITSPLAQQKKESILGKIKKRIEQFDKTYSRFRKDSLVTKISTKKGTYKMPPDAKELFSLYKNLYEATEHALTPLIGQTMTESGYDANYSLTPTPLTKLPKWEDAIGYHYPNLSVKKPILLDFGAAGKGYLVDIIAELIKRNGITDFYINAGGDILHSDPANKPIRVGLEHPTDLNKIIGVASITNQSICASAGNRRDWGKFHHIINPHTLSSPRSALSSWVIADSAILADGLATSLFFTSGKKLQTKFSFEYLILQNDFTCDASSNFPVKLYTDTSTLRK